MMTKLFMALFVVLTVGAGYMTYKDIGLEDAVFAHKSVRTGSGRHTYGGYGYGK